MTIQMLTDKASDIASADAPLGHVVTVSVLGQALAALTPWVCQIAHIAPPPPEDNAAIGVVLTVASSWILQKVSKSG